MSTKTTLNYLRLSLFVTLALICSACPLATQDETDSIVFWIPFESPNDTYLKRIAANYNETNPPTPVTVVSVPQRDITDISDLLVAMQAGTAPDVFMLDRFTVYQRAEQGVLSDMTPYLSGSRISRNNFREWAWAETLYQRKTYAIPFDADLRGLFYNKDMLRAAGIDDKTLATLDYINGPITHEELWDIVKTVTEHYQASGQNKLGFIPQMDQGWHYTWGFSFNGSFANPLNLVNDTGVREGFRFLYETNKELRDNGIDVEAFLSEHRKYPEDPDHHPFVQGNLAMTVHGDWFITSISSNTKFNFDYGVTYIPVPDEKRPFTWAGGYAFGIPATSKKTAAAMRFIAYACGMEGQRTYSEGIWKTPTDVRLFTWYRDRFFNAGQPFFPEVKDIVRIRPPLSSNVDYWNALSEAQAKVVSGSMTVEQALTYVQDTMRPILER